MGRPIMKKTFNSEVRTEILKFNKIGKKRNNIGIGQ